VQNEILEKLFLFRGESANSWVMMQVLTDDWRDGLGERSFPPRLLFPSGLSGSEASAKVARE
jgi:hypothetical protein